MRKNKEKNSLKSFFKILFLIYLAIVLYITLFNREPGEKRIDMVPLRSYYLLIEENNSFYFTQILYNILMTVPFGFLLPFIYKKMRSVFVVGLMGFLFSLSIETVQYITRRGLFEFDDLFNNTVGTVAGYIIFYIIQSILITFIDRKR